MAQQHAWRWALIGFIVTIVRGFVLSAGFDATLFAALMSLLVAYGLVLVCSALWYAAFEEKGLTVPTSRR